MQINGSTFTAAGSARYTVSRAWGSAETYLNTSVRATRISDKDTHEGEHVCSKPLVELVSVAEWEVAAVDDTGY